MLKHCTVMRVYMCVYNTTGVQPSVDGYEYELCEAIVKAYPPFQEACKKRGLDPEHICVDAW
jgi:Cu2+-containing amine oxidase